MPAIARDVAAHNPHFSAAVRRSVERLARDIEDDAPLPTPLPPGPDVQAWREAHAAHAGETWLATEWFYAEYAFYRELARCCRFWETGRDPFAWAKEEELAGEGPWARVVAAVSGAASLGREERIATLVSHALWGNRVDLSYKVAADRTHVHDEDLLADDRPAAAALLARPGARVHLVADNTGTELALDLALVDALLDDPQASVTLHVKAQPVFVSDATPADVWRLLDCMRGRRSVDLAALAERLCAAFDGERLSIAPDPFWSGPRFLWETPPYLRETLGTATIVLLKGDANYRRVVGDALWPPATPFRDACARLPFPVACVRTMKSDSILGLRPGLAEKLDATEPRWRIDGKRGVVQTCTGIDVEQD